ncbi:hypothetical protein SAMN05216276_103270 [Streptosporangium subroseum]|uniref:Uncharacterized protein n=1 Tax=Streptosporangium subroseum TaxID=106412 RepID=A0A239LGE0_9ACTN|nr:hypothetical protein SAMN05216276_103270 [Streptosporangium subroseum]
MIRCVPVTWAVDEGTGGHAALIGALAAALPPRPVKEAAA